MTKSTTTKSNTVKSTPAKKVVLSKQDVKNEIKRRTFAVGTLERKTFGPQAIVSLLNAELGQVLATPGSVAKTITAIKGGQLTTTVTVTAKPPVAVKPVAVKAKAKPIAVKPVAVKAKAKPVAVKPKAKTSKKPTLTMVKVAV